MWALSALLATFVLAAAPALAERSLLTGGGQCPNSEGAPCPASCFANSVTVANGKYTIKNCINKGAYEALSWVCVDVGCTGTCTKKTDNVKPGDVIYQAALDDYCLKEVCIYVHDGYYRSKAPNTKIPAGVYSGNQNCAICPYEHVKITIPCTDTECKINCTCKEHGGCGCDTKVCDDKVCDVATGCDDLKGGCTYEPKKCPEPEDKCKVADGCDDKIGCKTKFKFGPGECQSDLCYERACNPNTGECESTPQTCSEYGVDSDGKTDMCKINPTCDDPAWGCKYEEVQCSENTEDKCKEREGTCEPSTGVCKYAPKTCPAHPTDDGGVEDLCQINPSCDVNDGCTYELKDCPSTKCETCQCESTAGTCYCKHVTCEAKPCMVKDGCDSEAGCQYKPVDCDDDDECTTDTCENDECKHVYDYSKENCCATVTKPCTASSQCCGGLKCSRKGKCYKPCVKDWMPCDDSDRCCSAAQACMYDPAKDMKVCKAPPPACISSGAPCASGDTCCTDGDKCLYDDAAGKDVCKPPPPPCGDDWDACDTHADCCGELVCTKKMCRPAPQCKPANKKCYSADECCDGLDCIGGKCKPQCVADGAKCKKSAQCCPGSVCNSYICGPPPQPEDCGPDIGACAKCPKQSGKGTLKFCIEDLAGTPGHEGQATCGTPTCAALCAHACDVAGRTLVSTVTSDMCNNSKGGNCKGVIAPSGVDFKGGPCCGCVLDKACPDTP